jgi:hypothetical protein
MARKESTAKRRKKMLALKPDQGPTFKRSYLDQLPTNFCAGLSDKFKGKKLQSSKEEFWIQCAKEALRLDGTSESDEELRKAFAHHGMDPEDPRSWRGLLEKFCHVDFAGKGKGGAPFEWTDSTLMGLWNELKERGLSKLPVTALQAAKKLSKDTTSTFHDWGPTNLRVFIGRVRRAAKELGWD